MKALIGTHFFRMSIRDSPVVCSGHLEVFRRGFRVI